MMHNDFDDSGYDEREAAEQATVRQPPDRGATSLGQLDAHGLARLRQLILDVADSRPFWDLCKCTRYDGTGKIVYVAESDADAARLDFCDAVQAAIVKAAAPAMAAKGGQQ